MHIYTSTHHTFTHMYIPHTCTQTLHTYTHVYTLTCTHVHTEHMHIHSLCKEGLLFPQGCPPCVLENTWGTVAIPSYTHTTAQPSCTQLLGSSFHHQRPEGVSATSQGLGSCPPPAASSPGTTGHCREEGQWWAPMGMRVLAAGRLPRQGTRLRTNKSLPNPKPRGTQVTTQRAWPLWPAGTAQPTQGWTHTHHRSQSQRPCCSRHSPALRHTSQLQTFNGSGMLLTAQENAWHGGGCCALSPSRKNLQEVAGRCPLSSRVLLRLPQMEDPSEETFMLSSLHGSQPPHPGPESSQSRCQPGSSMSANTQSTGMAPKRRIGLSESEANALERLG